MPLTHWGSGSQGLPSLSVPAFLPGLHGHGGCGLACGTQHRFGETQADTVDKCLLVTVPVWSPRGLPWGPSLLFPWLFCTWSLEVREGEPTASSLLCLSVTSPQAGRGPCLETQWPTWPPTLMADSTSAPPCSLGPYPLPGSTKPRLPLLF